MRTRAGEAAVRTLSAPGQGEASHSTDQTGDDRVIDRSEYLQRDPLPDVRGFVGETSQYLLNCENHRSHETEKQQAGAELVHSPRLSDTIHEHDDRCEHHQPRQMASHDGL